MSAILCWHASLKPVTKWRPFAHFGTFNAAVDRILWKMCSETFLGLHYLPDQKMSDRKVYFYPATLDCRKTIRLPDSNDNDLFYDIIPYIRTHSRYGRHVFDPAFLEEVRARSWKETPHYRRKFLGICDRHGIDAIVYRNKFEDSEHFSYNVINPESIRVNDASFAYDFIDFFKREKYYFNRSVRGGGIPKSERSRFRANVKQYIEFNQRRSLAAL